MDKAVEWRVQARWKLGPWLDVHETFVCETEVEAVEDAKDWWFSSWESTESNPPKDWRAYAINLR